MDLKDIPAYEGFYAADAEGNIYRTERNGRRIEKRIALRPKKGYLVAHLCKDAIRKDMTAHRAVWQAFNGPIPSGLEINHKNGRRDDNRLANLELCTKSENALHKFRVNGYRKPYSPMFGMRNPASKLNDAQVVEIIRLYAKGGVTQKQLAVQFGVSQPAIGQIVRRKKWTRLAA